MKIIFTNIIFLFVFSFSASTQTYTDVFSIQHSVFSDAAYVELPDFNIQQKATTIQSTLPFDLKNNDQFIPSITYTKWMLDNDFYQNDAVSFHDLNLQMGYMKQWRNPFYATYTNVLWGITNDEFKVRSGFTHIGITLLQYYGKSNDLVWSAGFDYIRGSFGQWVVPLIGMEWKINSKTHLSMLTFSHVDFSYQLSNSIVVGINVVANPYNLNISDYYGIEDSVIYSYGEKFPYVPHKARVYTDLYLTNNVVLYGKLGIEFGKELFHTDNEEIIEDSAYYGTLDSSTIFEFGFAWRKFSSNE